MRLRFRRHSPIDTLLIVTSWLVGSIILVYGIYHVIPMLYNPMFTFNDILTIFLTITAPIIGGFILVYSMLCLIQS